MKYSIPAAMVEVIHTLLLALMEVSTQKNLSGKACHIYIILGHIHIKKFPALGIININGQISVLIESKNINGQVSSFRR